jgi:putative CocE/NonD family hydrolase
MLLAWCMSAAAQEKPAPDLHSDLAAFIRTNYTKYEHRIAMRDGKRMFTAVYVPKDACDTTRYPILLMRTPYSIAPYGVDNYPKTLGPSETLARSKYIFAYQDVRGQFMSEGEFVNVRPHTIGKADETSDAYDTIDWLVKNVPYNNGRVGTWGVSYPGFYAVAGMIDAHPALKAASPQAPIADWFIGDDLHHNGPVAAPSLWLRLIIRGPPARILPKVCTPSIRLRHARWLQFLLGARTFIQRE